MKRDMDLCRAILQEVERSTTQFASVFSMHADGADPEITAGHVIMLLDAGLLTGRPARPGESAPEPDVPTEVRLTASGHQFVEATREEETWNWFQDMTQRLPGISFEMAVPMIRGFAASKARELGIKLHL